MKTKLKILEVNNIDILGRRFNGYDLQEFINKNTKHSAKQIVIHKLSKNKKVLQFFKNNKNIKLQEKLGLKETEILSTHSLLSLTSPALLNNKEYKAADIVHYHMVHNTQLSLYSLTELMSSKPTVLSIHDPWFLTGRCVHPEDCQLWKKGCQQCKFLDTLFPLNKDNCKYLWKIKQKAFKNLDIDIVVPSKYIYDMLKESPITNHIENIHLIPFGIDLEFFSNRIDKYSARETLDIPRNDIVLFLRAQGAFKGTSYVLKAMKDLKTTKKITIITCSEKGHLDELKNKYNIIDLGDIDSDKMVQVYNACDIFLMPSIGESFGLMAVEAMACSKPVIVFDNSALPSVTFAPGCGVLVENKNHEKLAEAIQLLINDKQERLKRGKKGRKLAEKHYDMNEYNKKILELYVKAYGRQKNKNEEISKLNVNYNTIPAQNILYKLQQIHFSLFDKEKYRNIKVFEHTESLNKNINSEIDFSNQNVQNLIMNYNNLVYEIIKTDEAFLKRLSFLIIKVKERINKKIRSFTILHVFFRK